MLSKSLAITRRCVRRVATQATAATPSVNIASAALKLRTETGDKTSSDLFKGKKTIVVGVVGAFTGVCTLNHIPTYVKNADKFKAQGVDDIFVVAPNDHLVMKAWAESMQAGHTVKMVSDPDLALAKLLNQEVDLSAAGLGKRSHRFAMLVEDGEIKKFVREEKPGEVKVTDAESVLKMIGGEKK